MSGALSQFARLAWLIVGGMLVAWLVGHSFASHERMLHGTRTFALAMTDRMRLLGDLLERQDPTDQRAIEDLLTAFNAPGTEVQLSASPPEVPTRQWTHAHELSAALTEALDAAAPRAYRIAFPMARGGPHSMPRGPYVLIAMELSDGRWLTSRSTSSNMEWGWRHVAVSWSTVTMVLILATILWAARRTTRHLPRLALAAERLGIDVSTPPVEESGPREIRRTARAFNQMAARIRDHVDERTAMLAAVSHDLRTYLTRLELRAETIEDPDQRERTHRDIAEMDQMLEEVLSFAREERRTPTLVPLELRSLLESLVDEQQDLGRDAVVSAGTRVTVNADPVALKRALTNLLDNAVRYGARARVELRAEKGWAVLTIDDDGPGIPRADREVVLKPFQRLESSRNRTTGGSGLGLAIARTIVAKHHGTLELLDAPSGGLRVCVRLPADGTSNAAATGSLSTVEPAAQPR